jgi:hypothetical protein
MTLRIGKKNMKRCRRSVEHQQAVLLAFGKTIASGEFEDAPQLLAWPRPFRIGDRRFLRSSHRNDPYSAAARAGFAPGKKAANSPITSLIRAKSASDETA